jgi:hypothetical protein
MIQSPFFTEDRGSGPSRRNLMSYSAVDAMIWTGLRDIFNDFRKKTLGIPPVPHSAYEHSLLHHRRIPFTYCFSKVMLRFTVQTDLTNT